MNLAVMAYLWIQFLNISMEQSILPVFMYACAHISDSCISTRYTCILLQTSQNIAPYFQIVWITCCPIQKISWFQELWSQWVLTPVHLPQSQTLMAVVRKHWRTDVQRNHHLMHLWCIMDLTTKFKTTLNGGNLALSNWGRTTEGKPEKN